MPKKGSRKAAFFLGERMTRLSAVSGRVTPKPTTAAAMV
jgi:hypothetical protein